jgi:hypothetical protein
VHSHTGASFTAATGNLLVLLMEALLELAFVEHTWFQLHSASKLF